MNEQLRVIISAEVAKFKQNVNDARKQIQDFSKGGKESFQKFNDSFQKVGDVSKKVLKVMATAIAGAATALLTLAGTTKEYRQQQAMLTSAFETAGGSAEVAKETYNDLFRVLGDTGQATEAAQHLAKLTTEEKALSEWTNICQGVYATFGESLPIESLTEAVNHSAKLGEVQGTLADALEWSGVNMDEFNEQLFWCNSESEREKLIRDTLNGLYSDAAANYEENNAAVLKQNEAQAKLNEALAKLGEVAAPILTLFTEFLVDVLEPLTPMIKDFADKHGQAIADTLKKIADAVGKVLTWVADNWEIVTAIAGVITAISIALSVFTTVMTIVNAVMMASPLTWIILGVVAAIAAWIAIIVVLVKYWEDIDWKDLILVALSPIVGVFKILYDNCEGFRNFVDGFLNKIKGAFKDGFEWIKNKIISALGEDTYNKIENIFNKIVTTVKNIFNKLPDIMSSALNKAKSAVETIINAIKGFFSFEWSLPKIKVPKFSIKPSGWSIGDLLEGIIPKLGITWNARGGVFDKPTLFNYGGSLQGIGENGAEAVVPLENNTEWLSRIADMLAQRMGVGTPIILKVDGKTFAQTTINTLNQNTRQTGKLGINIM